MKVSAIALLTTLYSAAAFAPAAFQPKQVACHENRKATIVMDGKANGTSVCNIIALVG